MQFVWFVIFEHFAIQIMYALHSQFFKSIYHKRSLRILKFDIGYDKYYAKMQWSPKSSFITKLIKYLHTCIFVKPIT